ncbi:MAG: phage tail sheath family protein [Desulfamplus sp.]
MSNYKAPGVYIEEKSSGSKPIEGVATAVAAFIGVTERVNEEDKGKFKPISNWNQFIKEFCVGDGPVYSDNWYLPHAVYGFFENGGSKCYVASLEEYMPKADIRYKGYSVYATYNDYEINIETKKEEPQSNNIEIEEKIKDRQPNKFKVTKEKDQNDLSKIIDLINIQSKYFKLHDFKDTSSTESKDEPMEIKIEVKVLQLDKYVELFKGDLSKRTGIAGLEAIDDVNLICIPDLVAIKDDNNTIYKSVYESLIAHCEKMGSRMAIIDVPKDKKHADIETLKKILPTSDRGYGAVYYPWIKISDPNKLGKEKLIPPSGHIAGVYNRVDNERGLQKAPANEVIRGALDVEENLTQSEIGDFNEKNINCIQNFPGRGVRIWGARTLATDSEWKYINVRRLFNYVKKSIENGTQWAVFEPNDQDLWERIKRNVSAFLTGLWRNGALFGSTKEEAFYVICDESTNPPDMRDKGYVITEIGIAPVKPAEFVVFRISQKESGASVSE